MNVLQEGLGLHPRDENGRNLYSDVNFVDTWKAMEDCVKSGLTRSIGVSNFNSKQVQRILDNCTIKPVTNQVLILRFQSIRNLLVILTESYKLLETILFD